MRFWTAVRVLGRVVAVAILATAVLGGSVVAFAANAADQQASSQPQDHGPNCGPGKGDDTEHANDRGCPPGMSVSGVWNVTLGPGKFAGKRGVATLVQHGADVQGAITDGVHVAGGNGQNKGGAITLSGKYQVFGHTPLAITVYTASVVGQLSSDGKTISGTWADSLGDHGTFVATRR